MTALYAHTISNMRDRHDALVDQITGRATVIAENPARAGVGVYEQMTSDRWRVDALEYMLGSVTTSPYDDIEKFEEEVEAMLRGIRQDMVRQAAAGIEAYKYSPEPYWKEMGDWESKLGVDKRRSEEAARAAAAKSA